MVAIENLKRTGTGGAHQWCRLCTDCKSGRLILAKKKLLQTLLFSTTMFYILQMLLFFPNKSFQTEDVFDISKSSNCQNTDADTDSKSERLILDKKNLLQTLFFQMRIYDTDIKKNRFFQNRISNKSCLR